MSEELNQATKDFSLSEDKTVLESKEDFTVKHPLNSKWTLWYTKPPVDPSESWSDLLRPVVPFDTVEEFWGIFNAIPKANELPLKSDYHLFKNDIKPEWEDSENSKGGKFSFQFKGKKYDINEIWIRCLLSVIGETIEGEENEVNGIVLNVRKNCFKVGLWTKSCNKDSLIPIGETLRKVLNLSEGEKLEFMSHKDSNDRSAKPLFIVE
ncbi:unnamed protein product [[Candida] boidinii]|uniref:Unnamed protein product n=1 Tax=Candida boidinii TaxID=5477 RepID=A0ACB5TID2_CANBO|nr:unnamed protein product [[Candida] boidinii]